MSARGNVLIALATRFLGRLRFPQFFVLTAALFALDALIPDAIPFADEILLGLATMLLASWKDGRGEGEPTVPDADAAKPDTQLPDSRAE